MTIARQIKAGSLVRVQLAGASQSIWNGKIGLCLKVRPYSGCICDVLIGDKVVGFYYRELVAYAE